MAGSMRHVLCWACASAAFLAPMAPPRTSVSSATNTARAALPKMAAGAAKPSFAFGSPEPGPFPLVEERDACGVGFLADTKGRRQHDTIERALHALSCMEHRGGCGGDGVSGDGAGVMTSVPWELFEAEGALKGKAPSTCGVAMFFLPQKEDDALRAQAILEAQAADKGFEFLGWRDVPQDKTTLGPMALEALPIIRQAFVHHPTLTGDELERQLYQLRRSTQGDILNEPEGSGVRQVRAATCAGCHVCVLPRVSRLCRVRAVCVCRVCVCVRPGAARC